MARLKCKKCGAVFEYEYTALSSFFHAGPYKSVKCPACGKSSIMNAYSSVKEPVTWPPQEKQTQPTQPQLTEEEQEKKRIEDSKYEKP